MFKLETSGSYPAEVRETADPHLHSSFLPQDKVSEFAAMSPQQLLRETQRAAGDERLTSWHDTLIESGKELKQMLDVITYLNLKPPSLIYNPASQRRNRTA